MKMVVPIKNKFKQHEEQQEAIYEKMKDDIKEYFLEKEKRDNFREEFRAKMAEVETQFKHTEGIYETVKLHVSDMVDTQFQKLQAVKTNWKKD